MGLQNGKFGIWDTTAGANRLTIDTSGNVGIGTTSPTGVLDVRTPNNTDTNQPRFLSGGGAGTWNQIDIGANFSAYQSTILRYISGGGTAGTGYFAIMNRGLSDQVVVHGNGNVGIGMNNPYNKLHVAGNIGATGWIGAGCETNCEGGGGYTIIFDNGTISQSSDRRLKENIVDLSFGLDDLLKLRPVSYNMIGDKTKKKHLGFIAQEVEKVIPDAVFKNPNSKYMGLQYIEFTSVITKAVQEFYQKWFKDSEDLHKQVDALKAENAAMKEYLCAKDPRAPFCQRQPAPSK